MTSKIRIINFFRFYLLTKVYPITFYLCCFVNFSFLFHLYFTVDKGIKRNLYNLLLGPTSTSYTVVFFLNLNGNFCIIYIYTHFLHIPTPLFNLYNILYFFRNLLQFINFQNIINLFHLYSIQKTIAGWFQVGEVSSVWQNRNHNHKTLHC